MPKAKHKRSLPQRLGLFVAIIILAILGFTAWSSLGQVSEQASINRIGNGIDVLDYQRKKAPNGCYYEQVQCVREPCNPILVCPTPVASCVPLPKCPEGRMCATYLPPLEDGQVYCGSADPTPSPTCRPRPACLDEEPRCKIAETPDMCPPSMSKPAPTIHPVMKKRMCKIKCALNGWSTFKRSCIRDCQ